MCGPPADPIIIKNNPENPERYANEQSCYRMIKGNNKGCQVNEKSKPVSITNFSNKSI